jgi:CheY-like chemotaxis protein
MIIGSRQKEGFCMQETSILLVEDDEVLCDVVRRNLEARGYRVSVANDVQGALAHLRSQEYDLIVLDINLPDQTGWDVLRVAKSEGRIHPHEGDGGKLPVVVLSAVRVSPGRLAEFRPLAYLPKPFPLEALLRLAAEAAQHDAGGPEPASSNEEELHA